MDRQKEHDSPENLVETGQGEEEQAARSLEDAVDSHGTLEGYFAMNNVRDDAEREALELEAKAKRAKPAQDAEKK